jgi:hypothetical protein
MKKNRLLLYWHVPASSKVNAPQFGRRWADELRQAPGKHGRSALAQTVGEGAGFLEGARDRRIEGLVTPAHSSATRCWSRVYLLRLTWLR